MTVPPSITVIEIDDEMNAKNITEKLNVNYIFIPQKIANATGCMSSFPKSIAWNIGALFNDAEYYLLHDVDVLVQLDYISQVYLMMDVTVI